ncbi:hypothetical protein [Streptomyces sp. BE133]|nr:hypothetical protein [Streptomyces sp. BE133]MEE1807244.1 hypothetical protein [Streptomyces sp. BE133]
MPISPTPSDTPDDYDAHLDMDFSVLGEDEAGRRRRGKRPVVLR